MWLIWLFGRFRPSVLSYIIFIKCFLWVSQCTVVGPIAKLLKGKEFACCVVRWDVLMRPAISTFTICENLSCRALLVWCASDNAQMAWPKIKKKTPIYFCDLKTDVRDCGIKRCWSCDRQTYLRTIYTLHVSTQVNLLCCPSNVSVVKCIYSIVFMGSSSGVNAVRQEGDGSMITISWRCIEWICENKNTMWFWYVYSIMH